MGKNPADIAGEDAGEEDAEKTSDDHRKMVVSFEREEYAETRTALAEESHKFNVFQHLPRVKTCKDGVPLAVLVGRKKRGRIDSIHIDATNKDLVTMIGLAVLLRNERRQFPSNFNKQFHFLNESGSWLESR